MSAPRRFAVLAVLAVVVSGVLALLAVLVERDDIESDLTTRARDALEQAHLPTDVVTFSGRDATVRTDSLQ
ncbi:OmpA family protein, partial [Klebsiella pneumoniae]